VLALLSIRSLRADTLPELVSPEVDRAIRHSLDFLAGAQQNDCWSTSHGDDQASGSTHAYVEYLTGLSGIVLLQSGSTPHEGRYADAIMRATTYVMSLADEDGLISGGKAGGRIMYGHGMAMLFLSQVYGMLHDPVLEKRLQGVLTRAVAFSARYQSVRGGWHYTPTTASDEGSVAISQIHALRACHNAGIPVPRKTVERFIAYLEALEIGQTGGLAYVPGRGSRPLQGVTTAGAASFFLAGATDHPLAQRLKAYVSANINLQWGAGDKVIGHEEYIRFCTSTALFLWDDPAWPPYYRKMCKDLLGKQKTTGAWESLRMGEIYGTAMALYALQLPYRQLPILQQ
jgi:hypothetical protein